MQATNTGDGARLSVDWTFNFDLGTRTRKNVHAIGAEREQVSHKLISWRDIWTKSLVFKMVFFIKEQVFTKSQFDHGGAVLPDIWVEVELSILSVKEAGGNEIQNIPCSSTFPWHEQCPDAVHWPLQE